MPRFKLVNGEHIQFTAEEEAQRDQEEAEAESNVLNKYLQTLRFERDILLKETDWLANSDVSMSDDWKTYRQNLRDITNGLDTVEKVKNKLQFENGILVNFPVKPS
tara:strand:- start:249 stop:566 length:318 start_codon:yes stop_codon:yes gene_type:complete